MKALVQKIISDKVEKFSKDIITFQENYGTSTTFEELNSNKLRENLWETLFRYLSDSTHSSVHCNCLSVLRILSRDKTDLNELVTPERVDVILSKAALDIPNSYEEISYNDVIESLKLLCNLIFNSTEMQLILQKTSCLPCLIPRMRDYNDAVPYDIKLFDTRIVFLITALNIPMRHEVKRDLKGDESLINILENISVQCDKDKDTIKKDNTTLACEALKALFNLYMITDDTVDEEEKNKNLVSILYKLLLFKCETEDELQSNIANLLTVIPQECYSTLIPPARGTGEHVFEDASMTAISVLLRFLDSRLDCGNDLLGNLSPILTAFIRLIKAERLIRKYVRMQILPPLKDVMRRPEEGTSLRAKLCKLLTSPVTEVRDLAAEFLFVLCKENVNRMVKYTGYGNAAGMFANKGLLGPNRGKTANYFSESEDSETEEYLQHKEQINPVIGCFEPPKPNPLEGMTEEQKEYEALQLVGLVDKLTREGLVQPCRIGDDGKPKAIEHVLELQEELSKQQYTRDSDSD